MLIYNKRDFNIIWWFVYQFQDYLSTSYNFIRYYFRHKYIIGLIIIGIINIIDVLELINSILNKINVCTIFIIYRHYN